jgi:hypothetical protein
MESMGKVSFAGIKKIVSGGQTGVDLAAIDVAISHGKQCGGWCPKGRINESGKIKDSYTCFVEVEGDFLSEKENYAARTVRNILDSDGTLIIIPKSPLPVTIRDGTRLTEEAAEAHNKPYMVIDLSNLPDDIYQKIASWIREKEIETLNVAGPRESSSPGIYELSTKLIENALEYMDDPRTLDKVFYKT